MLEVALLPVSPSIEPAVLALNNAHAAELSWLDNDRLTLLLRQAFHARRIGEVDGFELAFDEPTASRRTPASDAFHAAQGFAEVGQAAIHQGGKTVRYLARALARARTLATQPRWCTAVAYRSTIDWELAR